MLALPFHIVITFSGLLLFMSVLLPWDVKADHKGDMQKYFAESRGRVAAARGEREASARGSQTRPGRPA